MDLRHSSQTGIKWVPERRGLIGPARFHSAYSFTNFRKPACINYDLSAPAPPSPSRFATTVVPTLADDLLHSQAAARLEAHLRNGPTPHILPEDDAQLEKVPVDDPPISTNTDAAFTALYRPLTQVPGTFLSPFRKSTFKPCPTSHLHTLGPILS